MQTEKKSADGLEGGWLNRQMQQATEDVRRLKRHSPHMFPEWQELQQARTALREAEERYAAARKRWRDMGSNAKVSRDAD